MKMMPLLVGFSVLLGGSFWARTIMLRALKALTQEQKALLIDLFASTNRWISLVMMGLVAAIFWCMAEEFVPWQIGSGLMMADVFFFMALGAYLTNKRLLGNDFPNVYRKAVWQSHVIRTLGLIGFLVFIVKI